MSHKSLSLQTRFNWLLDVVVFACGLIASITGIYFLFLPSGGYRGGRNPYYGITFLFDRHTWEDWHTWLGLAMIFAVLIHVAIHWSWIRTMTKRAASVLFAKASPLSPGAKLNIATDLIVAVSFMMAALSGLYFFFVPAKSVFVFNSVAWDLIHTWAFVAMLIGVAAHLMIHWRWITNVTGRMVQSSKTARAANPSLAAPAD
jgi:hypothetical protein